jgi:hypothetical protein
MSISDGICEESDVSLEVTILLENIHAVATVHGVSVIKALRTLISASCFAAKLSVVPST